MRTKHGLPLSPLALGRAGSGAARERLGDEHVGGKCGGEGAAVALLAGSSRRGDLPRVSPGSC